MPDAPRSMQTIVAEILTNKHLSHEATEQACLLLIADVRYNSWCASVKVGSRKASPETEDQFMERLAELEAIHDACEDAWRDFQAAKWPRGEYAVWAENGRVFTAVLRRCTERLEALLKRSQ